MGKLLRVGVLSAVCFALLGVGVASAALSVRVTKNSFSLLPPRLENAVESAQVESIVTVMGTFCKKLEIPDVAGCPDDVKYLKNLWKDIKSSSDDFASALELFKEEFLAKEGELEGLTDERYFSDEQLELLEQDLPKPYDVYKFAPDPERATSFGPRQATGDKKPIFADLDNPYDPLLELVSLWPSFYPNAVRKHPSYGAPAVWKLAEKYSIKLEQYYVGGFPEEIQILKDKIKTYSRNPSKNESIDTIVTAYTEVLTRLATDFENRYGGETRTIAQPPEPYVAGVGVSPFSYGLQLYNWWDNGSFFPSVVREKFGPTEVKSLRSLCNLFMEESDRELCFDETGMTLNSKGVVTTENQGTLASKLRKCDKCAKYSPRKKNTEAEAAKAFEIETSKEGIIDTFKEVVGRYTEMPLKSGWNGTPSDDETPPEETPPEDTPAEDQPTE